MTTRSEAAPDSGVQEMLARYARVRERGARILYVRNRLAGEVATLRSQLKQLHVGSAQAASLHGHLVRAERELEEVRAHAEEAKASLFAVLTSIRATRRDRLHALASDLATADAAENEVFALE